MSRGSARSFNGQTTVGDWRDNDAFLISYDPLGTLRWTRLWGSLAGDVGYGVVAENAGRVFVTGHAPSDQPFDAAGGVGLHSRYTIGVQFLTAFNAEGVKGGSVTWGSTNSSAEALAWDGASALYIDG